MTRRPVDPFVMPQPDPWVFWVAVVLFVVWLGVAVAIKRLRGQDEF